MSLEAEIIHCENTIVEMEAYHEGPQMNSDGLKDMLLAPYKMRTVSIDASDKASRDAVHDLLAALSRLEVEIKDLRARLEFEELELGLELGLESKSGLDD